MSVESVAPVCMTGVGCSIHPDSMRYFEGKRVRIAIHDDDAGHSAAEKWAGQLREAGVLKVDGFTFAGLRLPNGKPVSDLADFATLLDVENPPDANPMARFEAVFSPPPRPSSNAEQTRGEPPI